MKLPHFLTEECGFSLSQAVRSDCTAFYKECLSETMELYEISKDLLLSKGLYIRDPYLPNIEQINFVEKQGFLWDISGKKRPYS